MSKRKSSQVSCEDAVANILQFVEEDDDANLSELESSDEEDNGYIVDDLGNDLNGNESEGEESEEGEEEQLERVTQPSRKKLTRNPLVKSIDAALDMGNYDPITYLIVMETGKHLQDTSDLKASQTCPPSLGKAIFPIKVGSEDVTLQTDKGVSSGVKLEMLLQK